MPARNDNIITDRAEKLGGLPKPHSLKLTKQGLIRKPVAKTEMHHKSTTSAMHDNYDNVGRQTAAEKAAATSIHHPMSPRLHPSFKDELETDLNRNNSSSLVCQARANLHLERPDRKSNGYDHKLMKSSRFFYRP